MDSQETPPQELDGTITPPATDQARGEGEAAAPLAAAEAPQSAPMPGPATTNVATEQVGSAEKPESEAAEAPDGETTTAPADTAAAERWGVVEEDGTVRIRDGMFQGRVVGRVHWWDRAEVLGRLVDAFGELEEQYAALERDVRSGPNKGALLGRVRRLLERASTAKALGDFDRLVEGLRALEREVGEQVAERTQRKEELVARAEALSGATEWKATGEAYDALLAEWKAVGGVGDAEEALWGRFRAARDAFRQRRSEHFAQRDQARQAIRAKKEELIARAEALRESTDWRGTAAALRDLQAEWKQAGSAGHQDEALWTRFRGAMDTFFGRRTAFYEESRRRKEELIARAEELSASTDWDATTEAMRELHAAWRESGFAGPERDQPLWLRFRGAQDAFFARRNTAAGERERSFRESLARKEDLCTRAEALAYVADTDAARAQVEELQTQWGATGTSAPGRAADLERRFRRACDVVLARAREDEAGWAVEWKTKTRLALMRTRDEVADLRAAIVEDEASVTRWQAALAGPGADGPGDDGQDLEQRIAEARERIRSRQARIEEMEASMREIQAVLRA